MDELTDTAPAFVDMAHRIVWCTVATVDPAGGARTRILHPIWEWDGERLTGWIATAPTPVKARGIDADPHVSLTYWDPAQDTCTADCRVSWIDDSERETLWARFADGPEPVGYDPAIIEPWADGPTSPAFSGWRLDPYRLRVMPGSAMLDGQGLLLWRE
ncbi:MAG: pyridoxamine 5'-phosphate oxidase [Acidimicrobiales bacterium]|nr:MAG: pyridoxamine 5'-phosphate oxidase [Acidimicrobiales bacterium]